MNLDSYCESAMYELNLNDVHAYVEQKIGPTKKLDTVGKAQLMPKKLSTDI